MLDSNEARNKHIYICNRKGPHLKCCERSSWHESYLLSFLLKICRRETLVIRKLVGYCVVQCFYAYKELFDTVKGTHSIHIHTRAPSSASKHNAYSSCVYLGTFKSNIETKNGYYWQRWCECTECVTPFIDFDLICSFSLALGVRAAESTPSEPRLKHRKF